MPHCSFVLLQFCPHREVSLIFSQLLAGGRWVLAQSSSSPCYLLTPISVCTHKICVYVASNVQYPRAPLVSLYFSVYFGILSR